MHNIVFDPVPYFALYSHFDDYNCRLADLTRLLLGGSVSSILDLGCGIGLSTTALRAAFPEANIQGVDQSPSMIAYAKNKFSDPQMSFGVSEAASCLQPARGQLLDLVHIKSAYHLFERDAPVAKLAQLLKPSGALVIIERTERSAKSYPLFDAASSHWSNYFAAVRQAKRLEAARSAGLEIRVASYGEYIEVPADAYLNAIRAGQLSFLQPFREELISAWCASEPLHKADTVLVFEEFWVYVHTFNRTIPETCPE